MTTATLVTHGRTMDAVDVPRRSLEELVDRLIEALFTEETPDSPAERETARLLAGQAEPSVARSIHEARRLRQAGDLDGALALLAGMDAARAEQREARWAFSEWKQLVKRRFGSVLLYSQRTGRAAALIPCGDGGTLEVAAVLGMRWEPGKLLSRRSLRGLRPLAKGGA